MERDNGQSWTTVPPAIIPGFNRIAVPVEMNELGHEIYGQLGHTGDRYLNNCTICCTLQKTQQANLIV